MKRVLIFFGNQLCYNTLNIFAKSIESCLGKMGHDVVLADAYSSEADFLGFVEQAALDGLDAALAFNADGNILACRDILNAYGIPLYDWIVDHPCDHIKVLNASVDDLNVITLDRDHVGFIKRHIDNVRSAHMIPLGGFGYNDCDDFSEESFHDRKYGLIFTGSYVPYTRFEESILSLPDRMKKLTVLMIEYMLTNRMSTNEEALDHALRQVIGTDQIPSNVYQECAYYTSNSNVYVRHFVREEIMRFIVDSGVRIDIFGPGWERLGFDRKKNVVLHDRVDYIESAKACTEAKLSLNIMPWFKDGLHDRIPTAMMNGSAVVTDSSRYINEIFKGEGDDKDIFLFDINKPENVPSTIEKILSDDDKLFQVAQRGRTNAINNMTWKNRAEELRDYFDNHFLPQK